MGERESPKYLRERDEPDLSCRMMQNAATAARIKANGGTEDDLLEQVGQGSPGEMALQRVEEAYAGVEEKSGGVDPYGDSPVAKVISWINPKQRAAAKVQQELESEVKEKCLR